MLFSTMIFSEKCDSIDDKQNLFERFGIPIKYIKEWHSVNMSLHFNAKVNQNRIGFWNIDSHI
jgi:hypothetical protein